MRHRKWTFDIDAYINPLLPPPPWRILPPRVTHWFGHRPSPPAATGNLMPIFWSFVGIFASIALIESVSIRVPSLLAHHSPLIVGSFGAAAVLEFYAIEAPLAQPRNAIGGQLVSALVGVAIGKLFRLSPRFEEIKWLGGALACACATALMALTKTVHPPAGATALLAVVDSTLIRVGWFLIPVMMLGCALMLAVALLINNIERRFPVYWWTPEDLRPCKVSSVKTEETTVNEKSVADEEHEVGVNEKSVPDEDNQVRVSRPLAEVVIRRGEVLVPNGVRLSKEEKELLEALSNRL